MLYVKQPVKNSTMRVRSYNHSIFRANSALLRNLYKGECIMCKQIKQEIEIHHNDRNRDNHEIQNLAHVCKTCHNQIHLTNFKFDNLKELLVEKLRFMVKCLESVK